MDPQASSRIYLPPRMPAQDNGHRHIHPQAHAAPAKPRSSNRVRVQPASPEVISSLITSLSAISSPADDHFERGPRVFLTDSVPPSPTYTCTSATHGENGSTLASAGLRGDHGAYGYAEKDRDEPYKSKAAVSPVIRTSRPPSGLSPITAPKRSSITSSIASAWKEPLYTRGAEMPSSIGAPSIEPGLRTSSASVKSFGSSGQNILRSQKSLDLKASKGKMREMDRERKRKAKEIDRSSAHHSRVGSRDSTQLGSPIKDSIREDESLGSPQIPIRASSTRASIGASSGSRAPDEDVGDLGVGLAIPMRDSSLRHSVTSTAARRKRKSHRPDLAPVGGEHEDDLGETSPPPHTEMPDDPEEDEVSRRIRELKAQKEARDRRRRDDDREERQRRKSYGHSSDSPSNLDPSIAQKIREEPIAVETKEQGSHRRDVNLLSTGPRAPLKSLGISSIQRALSNEGRPPKSPLAPAKVSHDFESQYNAQKTSTSPFSSTPQPISPTSLEINRGTYLNPIAPGVKSTQYDERPSTADSIDEEVENYLSLARLSQKIHHPTTGRVISFSDVGDPDGYAVVCCVGMGLTRYLTAFYDELALTLKLRLITLDRPGVGESESYTDGTDTPLGWPDDVKAVCQYLNISRFSILAHSAGAIYALATALRMPQHIRGRIHLLAPWIPPSQLSTIGSHQEPLPVSALPYTQRLLRSLPTPFLKAANSNFFSATSTSITTSLPKSPRRTKRKSLNQDTFMAAGDVAAGTTPRSEGGPVRRPGVLDGGTSLDMMDDDQVHERHPNTMGARPGDRERQTEYDTRLTHAIWELATANANPAVDLLVCLERRQEIGFRYVDITKAVVIHHGSRDSRVPVENVKWLGKTMRRCEVRVLEGEGHGLMASAAVMGSVLTEISKEWEDWNVVVKGKRAERRAGGS